MSSQISKYKDAYFYSHIISLIKEYAIQHNDRVLIKYINSNKLSSYEILNNLTQFNDIKIMYNMLKVFEFTGLYVIIFIDMYLYHFRILKDGD